MGALQWFAQRGRLRDMVEVTNLGTWWDCWGSGGKVHGTWTLQGTQKWRGTRYARGLGTRSVCSVYTCCLWIRAVHPQVHSPLRGNTYSCPHHKVMHLESSTPSTRTSCTMLTIDIAPTTLAALIICTAQTNRNYKSTNHPRNPRTI